MANVSEETPIHISTETGSRTIMGKTQVSSAANGDIFVTVTIPDGALDDINLKTLTGFSIDHYNSFSNKENN